MPDIKERHRSYRRLYDGVELTDGRFFIVETEYRSWLPEDGWTVKAYECTPDMATNWGGSMRDEPLWVAVKNGAKYEQAGHEDAQAAFADGKRWLADLPPRR